MRQTGYFRALTLVGVLVTPALSQIRYRGDLGQAVGLAVDRMQAVARSWFPTSGPLLVDVDSFVEGTKVFGDTTLNANTLIDAIRTAAGAFRSARRDEVVRCESREPLTLPCGVLEDGVHVALDSMVLGRGRLDLFLSSAITQRHPRFTSVCQLEYQMAFVQKGENLWEFDGNYRVAVC